MEVRLDTGNRLPVGRSAEHVGSRAAVDRQRGPTGAFHFLSNVAGIDRIAARAETDLGRDRRRGTRLGHGCHDPADAIGIPQEIRSALGLFAYVGHRAAEIDVYYADVKVAGQTPANLGQERGIVVPDLPPTGGARPARPIAAREDVRDGNRSPRSPGR